MTVPLVILALLAALGGALNLPEALCEALGGRLGHGSLLEDGLQLQDLHWLRFEHPPELLVMACSTAAALAGVLLAWLRYMPENGRVPAQAPGPSAVDGFYAAAVVRPLRRGAAALWFWMDRILIDGVMVEGPAAAARAMGALARRAQSGFASASLAYLLVGTLLLLWLLGGPR